MDAKRGHSWKRFDIKGTRPKIRPIDLTHHTDLDLGSDSQYNTIGLDAFLLAAAQFALGGARLIYQSTTQAEAGRSALAKAEFDEPALTSEHLGG